MTKPSGKTKVPDKTNTHLDVMESLLLLQEQLVNLQDPKHAPHASREEREAARWLYEQTINFKGMLRKRPLTRTIEFIVGAHGTGFEQSGSGWYHQPVKKPGDKHNPAFNWYGPFPSHHAAEVNRIKDLPRTQMDLRLAQLFED